jgi:hypothetical protein
MVFALLLILTLPQSGPAHDKAYWQSIVSHGFEVPEGASAPALARELSALLASPDPELRDGCAYSIFVSWIFQKKLLQPADVRALALEWQSNLKAGIGSTGDDATMRRSFSALSLGVVIARDNAEPFLEPAEVRAILDAALTYLQAERDVRGYDEQKGWIHSAAHTADLIKFLSRSRVITADDQRKILDAVTAKLRGAGQVFVFGEDERYARAVLSIVNRQDLDQDGFKAWVTRSVPAKMAAKPVLADLNAAQNTKNMLAKLEVLLSQAADPVPAQIVAARDAVRAALKTLF